LRLLDNQVLTQRQVLHFPAVDLLTRAAGYSPYGDMFGGLGLAA